MCHSMASCQDCLGVGSLCEQTDTGGVYSSVQQSPDNHTMLNHTTLLFATNFPGIKWNVNKFALIIARTNPDNHTIMVKFSTFTAYIYHFLLPVSSVWFVLAPETYCKCLSHLIWGQMIDEF